MNQVNYIIRPLSEVIGIEVSEFHLSVDMKPNQIAEIKKLIGTHQLVVFRNQNLSPLEQIELARLFGEIVPHPLKANNCFYSEFL